MEKQQSITPEVVAILSEIREQAHQYNKAFESFDALIGKAEESQKETDAYMARFQNETRRMADEFQEKSNEAVSKIDAKISSIDYIFQELDTIQNIKASLQTLEDTFKKNTATLTVVVDNIKTLIVRQVENEVGSLDRKINALNENYTERFAVIDQKLEELQKQDRRNFVILDEEIGQFKGKVQETKYIVDETIKLVNLLVEKAEGDLYAKFDEAKESMGIMMAQLEKTARDNEEQVKRIILESDTANLSMKVIEIASQINDIKTRLGSAFWISIISIFISICLIAAMMIMKI